MEGMEVSFRWIDENRSAGPAARVKLSCDVNGCVGHSTYKFRIYGQLDSYHFSTEPAQPKAACHRCGIVREFTRSMQAEVIRQAADWARPDVEKFLAEEALEQALWERLGAIGIERDIAYTLYNAGVDIREVYRQEADQDFDRLAQLLSGSWEEAVLTLTSYIPPHDSSERGPYYLAPFMQHPWWRTMVWEEGDSHEALPAHRQFYDFWMKHSQGWIRDTGRMTEREAHMAFEVVVSETNSETDFILNRLIQNGPFTFASGKKLKTWSLTRRFSPTDKQYHYGMVVV